MNPGPAPDFSGGWCPCEAPGRCTPGKSCRPAAHKRQLPRHPASSAARNALWRHHLSRQDAPEVERGYIRVGNPPLRRWSAFGWSDLNAGRHRPRRAGGNLRLTGLTTQPLLEQLGAPGMSDGLGGGLFPPLDGPLIWGNPIFVSPLVPPPLEYGSGYEVRVGCHRLVVAAMGSCVRQVFQASSHEFGVRKCHILPTCKLFDIL
jgi:hypothetical protein